MKTMILLFLVISNIALAQTSKLYDKDHRLFFDKSYRIDEHSFNNLTMIEKVLLPKVYNSIRYSAIAAENEFEGTIIVELSISAEAKDYQVKIVKPQADDLNQTVLRFFNYLPEYARRLISPAQGRITVFIPITFEILKNNYNKLLEKNKSLTIQLNPMAPDPKEAN